MRVFWIIPFLFALTQTVCIAQHPIPSSDSGKSLLWRIEHPEYKTSWLFGTMHMICKEDYVWTPAMEQALQQSNKVCFEMDLGDPTVLMHVAMGMMDNSGNQLRDYFTPEQYGKLEAYARDSLGTSLAMFEGMKPFALQMLLFSQEEFCDSMRSYETELLAIANRERKSTAGLESPAEQLEIIGKIPTDSVVATIIEMLDLPSQDFDEYQKLTALYKDQDLPGLHQLLHSTNSIEGLLDLFLDNRNQQWTERIAALMSQEPTFFAVGAGHLWGEQGLITLLHKKGFIVTQVN